MSAVTKTSVTVSFILKEPNIHNVPNKGRTETIIIFRVTAGRGVECRFSIGYKINPKFWNKTNQRVKNVAAVSNSVLINNNLEELKNKFNIDITEKISKKIPITKEIIKEVFDKVSNKRLITDIEEKMTFFKFCDVFIENKKKTLPKKRGNKSETVSVYEQAIGFIKRFSEEENYKVDFGDIDLNFYHEFIEFMQTIEKENGEPYSANTIGKHIKTLKTILNDATYSGYNTYLYYKHSDFKIIREDTTAIYLKREELLKLYNLDLSKYPQHEKARDIFFIGCETGQRVSDYNRFSECTITEIQGKDYIEVEQKKTGNTVYCLITDSIQKIIDTRYNGKFPDRMAEPVLNRLIKEVGQMAKINEDVIFKRTEGGTKKQQTVSKYSLIATHTARRTYATIKYNAGVRVHDIMELTGHKTEKEFLKYIREEGKNKVALITESKEFQKSLI